MHKPKLKTPPKPLFAYLDLDSVLFKAAQAGQKIRYKAVDQRGKVVAEFGSAHEYKNWKESIEFLGGDFEFGFTGDVDSLTREVEYKIGNVEDCYKAFDHIVNDWVEASGCEDWVGYVSKATGQKNFRYSVATLKGYKSSASRDAVKPHYLEDVRKYANQNPKIKTARGSVEVDDVTCALAQKKGWRGCVLSVDKDASGCQNTHIFNPDVMDEPVFSSNKIVGRLWQNEKGKVVGLGTLFWLFQCVYGDSVDSIPGCKGVGEKGAYNLLKEFDGVDVKYLPEVVDVVCEAFKSSYGDEYEYEHCTTGEIVTASWKDLAMEMSRLVYMKKNQNDDCFWLDLIEKSYEEFK